MRPAWWSVLWLLSLAVAGYALSLALLPSFRAASPLATQLMSVWPVIAFTHFAGGGVALAVGTAQFVQRIRARRPAVHRWLGRLYVVCVLCSGSAGLFMALRSEAGDIARAGFGTLAIAWLWSTVQAYRAIRNRQVALHRAWMFTSFALTLAAVTLRIYLPLSQLAGWPFAIAYPAIAWLCWVPNLGIAAWLAPVPVVKKGTLTGPSLD
jgi:uncharacterized membrane protein